MDDRLPQALCRLLERRHGEPVSLVETTLSWVVLAPRVALKLKKPVRLAFADYGNIAARLRCCLEELRVNRRFARGLYRGVLAVRGTPGDPRFDGPGEPIDHVVCMRRFPDGAVLASRDMGELDAGALARFARDLGEIHQASPRVDPAHDWGSAAQVTKAVFAVASQLQAMRIVLPEDPLQGWLEAQARAHRDGWEARRLGGRVRDCHGDLHLGNLVMLEGRVVAFDAIDFDPALRWIDVVSDVAFLAMDLEARGRADLAFGFLDDYLQASGDYAGVAVLRVYAAYRALVRCLATALAPPGAGPDYLAAARRWAGECCPRLVIMHGLSGSGKSTVARRLLQAAGAIRIRSDVERKRLHAAGVAAGSADSLLYSSAASLRTYARLARAARVALAAGFPVIVDATFLEAGHRRHFETIARRCGVPFEILHCEVEDAVSRQRLEARERAGTDPSDATIATWQWQRTRNDPLTAEEAGCMTGITGDAEQVEAVAGRWTTGASLRGSAPAGRPR